MPLARKLLLAATATAALWLAAEASACSIPAPPTSPTINAGESQPAFTARLLEWKQAQAEVAQREAAEQLNRQKRREAGLWEAASQIVLVEVIAAGYVKPKGSRDRWAGMPQVTLRVTQIGRGLATKRKPFKLRYEDTQWCLMGPAAEVVQGRAGEKFVIFAERGELGMATLLGGYGPKTAHDPQTLELLARGTRPATAIVANKP